MEILSSSVTSSIPQLGLPLILVVPLLSITVYFIYLRYFHPLSKYPGPFLASITPLYRAWQLYSGRYHILVGECIERYGPVYRDAPDSLMFSDPRFLEVVYGRQGIKQFPKHKFLYGLKPRANDDDFSTFLALTHEHHTRMRRNVAGVYALSNVKKFEPMIDEIIEEWLEQLEKRKSVEFGIWAVYLAMDVITKISLNNKMGFIAAGGDVNGYYESLETTIPYMYWIGAYQCLIYFFKHPWVSRFVEPKPTDKSGIGYLYGLTLSSISTILAAPDSPEPSIVHDYVHSKTYSGDPIISNPEVRFGEALATIQAGSDSTGWAIAATLSLVLRHPNVFAKLCAEIRAADIAGDLSSPVMQYREGERLEYLQACIKETMRIYPAFPGRLTRTTDGQGANILGYWVPPNTEIGVNMQVLQLNKEVFGIDAAKFIPERWLPADGKRARNMEKHFGAWGYGPRSCLGKSIALMEITKSVGEVIRRFDVRLVDPEKPMNVVVGHQCNMYDMDVLFERRRE